MKVVIRNALAAFFRTLPYFKGKYRLGPVLIPALTNYEVEQDCIVTFKMRDRSTVRLDLRSFIEQVAFFSGEYDYGIIQRLSRVLKPGSTVFDVGANVGLYSIALGRKLKNLAGSSKLWAFEPVESNFNGLVNQVKLNNLTTIVNPVRVALGNQEGDIQLHRIGEGNSSTTGNAVWLQGSLANKIPPNCSSMIIKLDTFVQTHKIEACDLIKIDIEGAELEFLRGGSNLLSTCRAIIYGEFNKYWSEEFGYSFVDVAKLVKPWGYDLYEQKGRQNFIKIKEPTVGIQNVLMIPEEAKAKSPSLLSDLGILQ